MNPGPRCLFWHEAFKTAWTTKLVDTIEYNFTPLCIRGAQLIQAITASWCAPFQCPGFRNAYSVSKFFVEDYITHVPFRGVGYKTRIGLRTKKRNGVSCLKRDSHWRVGCSCNFESKIVTCVKGVYVEAAYTMWAWSLSVITVEFGSRWGSHIKYRAQLRGVLVLVKKQCPWRAFAIGLPSLPPHGLSLTFVFLQLWSRR